MYKTTSRWHKPLRFASFAAAGCLLGAMLGEMALALLLPPPPPAPPPAPPLDILFVLDVTGSMGEELEGVRKGIDEFASQFSERGLDQRVGLIAFGDRSNREEPTVLSFSDGPFTSSVDEFRRALTGVGLVDGGDLPESSYDALALASRQPFRGDAKKVLILITDAEPKVPDTETQSIESLTPIVQAGKIDQVHVVVPDEFRGSYTPLQTLAPGEVFSLNDVASGRNNFDSMLPVIASRIADTVQGVAGSSGYAKEASGRVALAYSVWTGFLALGITIALLLAQMSYMRRTFAVHDLIGVVGGLVVGCAVGAAGQLFFELASSGSGSSAAGLSVLARLSAWALLGCGLGGGMSLFIPNLKTSRAVLGGALGGVVGALGFLLAAAALGDVPARWLGAALVGFFIGLMVVLAEVAFRKVWLHVSYSAKDFFDVNLGDVPIGVGSDGAQCRVLAREAAPIAARYGLDHGQAYYEDVALGRRTPVGIGEARVFGNVTVTVQGEDATPGELAGTVPPPLPLAPSPAVPLAPAPGSVIETPAAPVPPPIRARLPDQPPPVMPSPTPASAPLPAMAPTAPPVLPSAGPPSTSSDSSGRALPVWILKHPQSPLRLPAGASQVTVGRGSQNQIVLSDDSVSTRHAVLEVVGSKLAVTDLGSTNGTFVNGNRLQANMTANLRPGDTLTLGRQEYRVQRI